MVDIGIGLLTMAFLIGIYLIFEAIRAIVKRYRYHQFLTVDVMKTTLELLAALAKSRELGSHAVKDNGLLYIQVHDSNNLIYVDTNCIHASGYRVHVDFTDISDYVDGSSLYSVMTKWCTLDEAMVIAAKKNESEQLLQSVLHPNSGC